METYVESSTRTQTTTQWTLTKLLLLYWLLQVSWHHTFIEHLSQIRLVYTACTRDDYKIIVIHYRVDAHKAASQSGLAPALSNYLYQTFWWLGMVVHEDYGR